MKTIWKNKRTGTYHFSHDETAYEKLDKFIQENGLSDKIEYEVLNEDDLGDTYNYEKVDVKGDTDLITNKIYQVKELYFASLEEADSFLYKAVEEAKEMLFVFTSNTMLREALWQNYSGEANFDKYMESVEAYARNHILSINIKSIEVLP